MANWFDNWIKNTVKEEVDELLKAASADDVPEKRDETPDDDKPEIGRQAVLTDPFFGQTYQQTLYKYKVSRLSNKTLKDVSLRDWLISSIIQNRCDTLMRFARPQIRKFDMGYRIVKITENEEYTAEEKQEIENLQAFIYNCGRMEHTPDDDKMLFGEFIKLVVRDALTFGHIAVEKVKTRNGALHRFRPLPAENVYLINKNLSRKQIADTLQQAKPFSEPKSDNDPIGAYTVNTPEHDYYKYVQMSGDNRPLAIFGDEDMIFRLFNPQNFADTNGYAYSPLELAIINVTNHMNTEQYNSNFFTHGQAAKGVLHLKGTVTQSQLTAFRRQFYNLINGSQNAWRTPIIAGLDGVEWVPMAGGSKEMEYLNYNMHLMRAICTQFQIDPVELGLDLLVTGGKAFAAKDGNQAKVEFSRERGLYPLLMYIEDVINRDIMTAIDPEYAKKYKFQFEGYTDETPQTEIALLQAEMTVNKSMNDLLMAARKEKIDHPVGDLNMNAAFWAVVEKNMTRGEIRETFFGDKGASAKKELQYIPMDPMFLQWQTLLFQMDQQKQMQEAQAQQAEQMQAQASHQQEMEAGQHQRETEKHQAEMNQVKGQAAYNASMHGKSTHSTKDVVGKNLKNPLD